MFWYSVRYSLPNGTVGCKKILAKLSDNKGDIAKRWISKEQGIKPHEVTIIEIKRGKCAL